jgi:hypothetical protein
MFILAIVQPSFNYLLTNKITFSTVFNMGRWNIMQLINGVWREEKFYSQFELAELRKQIYDKYALKPSKTEMLIEKFFSFLGL